MAAKKKISSSHALPAYAGFAAQPTRMALLLLKAAPGALVSLELLDDVAVHGPGGQILASQIKAGTKKNPVIDRSVELWKTFANWVRQIRSRELDPSVTTFELYVRREFAGSWVRRFAHSKSKQSATELYEEAKMAFWGLAPDFPKKTSVAQDLQPHLDEIFGSAAGARAFKAVIERFRFTVGTSGSLEQELHNHVSTQMAVEPAAVEKTLCHFHGWLKREIDRQIESSGRAPVIAKDAAWLEFTTYHRSIVTGGNLPDVADRPQDADLAKLVDLPFVRQLQLVRAPSETQRYAMTCYFRAASARTRWVDHELVRAESLDDLEIELTQAHRDYRAQVYSDSSHSDEVKGGNLLSACHRHRCRLEGKDAPEYFMPGCFHHLADRRLVGWHPRFVELMLSVA